MKLVPVRDLFDAFYGVNLEYNKLTPNPAGINFVSRSAVNNGVTGVVEPIKGLEPIPAGTLSVAGGGSVLETFLQYKPYYSGRDLYYLVAKTELTTQQKLFYCLCIKMNKYRYNYGRQANRTLRDILIPHPQEIPNWIGQEYNNLKSEWASRLGGGN